MDYHRLAQGPLVVTLHPDLPAVGGYQIGPASLAADPHSGGPRCLVFSPPLGRNATSSEAGLELSCAARKEATRVSYAVSLGKAGKAAIGFTLEFRLEPSGLTLSLAEVREAEGYQLVHVEMPRLLSASSTDARSRLVVPSHGGRRIDPARCEPGERAHRYNWVREAFSQVGIAYAPGIAGILELESLNDWLLSSVYDEGGARWASVGVRMVHRMEARRPDLQFPAHSRSSVRVSLLGTALDDLGAGWVPAARRLHDQRKNPNPDLYRGRFIYKVFVGKPGTPAEVSFETALEGVRRRFHLFDGGEQVCYLVGFQHEGHDSGYPHVFTVNQAAGGMKTLLRVIEAGRAYNTTISFHDNYDDAYDTSPSWDPADIGTDLNGDLLKGGVWNGVQAYWISLPKYVRTKAPARLRATLDLYPVRETYHLDVLTASVFRTDYDPKAPSDRNDDLAARKRLADLFRGNGLDVTTEGCGLPFLETFRYFWDLPRPAAPVYEGDEPIPLAAFIAHGTTCYGGSEADRYGIVEGLYFGAFHSKDFTNRTTETEMLDAFYLLFVPLNLLRDKAMVGYEERGAFRRITYQDGSTVEVDFQRLTHRVTVGGQPVVEDFASFAPGPRAGTRLLYVSALQDLGTRMRRSSWSCPPEWRSSARLLATALTPEGEGETIPIPVREDGTIPLEVPIGVPYRVRPEAPA